MLFYKIKAGIRNYEEPAKGEKDHTGDILKMCSEESFMRSKGDCFIFVRSLVPGDVVCGAIAKDERLLHKYFDAFVNKASFDLEAPELEEITMREMEMLIRMAYRRGFIYDDSRILYHFGLEYLLRRDEFFTEEILEDSGTLPGLKKRAEGLLCGESIIPELERIFTDSPASKKVKGHPVHYMVSGSTVENCKKMTDILLTSLFMNGRITNRRHSILSFNPCDMTLSEETYEKLYSTSIGGALVIVLDTQQLYDDDVELSTDTAPEEVASICKYMRKYKNDVLTVFCILHDDVKLKDHFLENLGICSVVELKEETASGDKARKYLSSLARQHKIGVTKDLLSLINDENAGYLAGDLQKMFDEWFSVKLKKKVYPQYSGIGSGRKEIAQKAPKGSAYTELCEMIGLAEAKKVMDQALNYYKAQKLFAHMGMTHRHPAMHMVFTGNPGTAKTSVARLFARIMKENGILSKGDLYEVGRADLVGKFVGSTAPLVKARFKQAKGGVLFIDEAYSLVDDRDGLYGDEAINTIVQEMENNRDDMVVIFAGYPDKMEGFLRKNPGLRSRIAFHIPFEDYSTRELCSIAELIAGHNGLSLTDDAAAKLEGIFAAARTRPDFGNGRYARNLIEKARMALANRLVSMDIDSVTERDMTTICAEDIEIPPEPTVPYEARRIGF